MWFGVRPWVCRWVTCCWAARERVGSRDQAGRLNASSLFPHAVALPAVHFLPILPSHRNKSVLFQFPHCFQMMKMFLSLGFSSAFVANDWRSAMKYNSSSVRRQRGRYSRVLAATGEEKACFIRPGCPEDFPCLCSESGIRDHSLRNIPMT